MNNVFKDQGPVLPIRVDFQSKLNLTTKIVKLITFL